MDIDNLRPTPAQRNYIKELFAKAGSLSSEGLVRAATPQDSPIHDLFVWNNRRAGHLYRLRQAARILRSYAKWFPRPKARAPKENPKTPIAVKLKPTPNADERKWFLTANALEDKFLRSQLILDRIGRVKTSIEQLLVLPELKNLHRELNGVIDRYLSQL